MNRKGTIIIVGTLIICLFLATMVLFLGAEKYGVLIAKINIGANFLWILFAALFIEEKKK